LPALGYIIVLILVFGLTLAVSFVIAAVLSFGAIPLIYAVRHVPKEKRRIGCLWRGVLTLVIGTALTVALMAFYIRADISFSKEAEHDYWGNAGEFDSYRMPLEYPYELTMVDVRDYASIGVWSYASNAPSLKQEIHGIRRYSKQGHILVGETDDDRFGGATNKSWFWFDCASGNATVFTNRNEFAVAVGVFGFTNEPALLTVEQNWDAFWANESNWKDKKIPGQSAATVTPK